MSATKNRQAKATRTERTDRTEPLWNVILHDDWDNSMPRVVVILKRVVSGIASRRATRIMYEAHTRGKAVVNSCHKELAELYEERLRERGFS
jgi:ATP-dependent Clp protease adapter protein ClpS